MISSCFMGFHRISWDFDPLLAWQTCFTAVKRGAYADIFDTQQLDATAVRKALVEWHDAEAADAKTLLDELRAQARGFKLVTSV